MDLEVSPEHELMLCNHNQPEEARGLLTTRVCPNGELGTQIIAGEAPTFIILINVFDIRRTAPQWIHVTLIQTTLAHTDGILFCPFLEEHV